MHTRRRALPILARLLLVTPPDAAAQAPAATPSPVASSVPAAKPEDVASIEAIINALYASISGPAGHARDWNRPAVAVPARGTDDAGRQAAHR